MNQQVFLVALDGSEWGSRAAERAFKMAHGKDTKIKLITVINWPVVQPVVMEGVVMPPIDRASEERYAKDKIFTPIIDKCSEPDSKVETQVLWGEPVDVICKQIKACHADLIFVGRHGHSRVVDLLLGSVANKLAHSVEIPIVLVP